MEATKRFIGSIFSVFSIAANYYKNYPCITRKSDLCAYYRSQNVSFFPTFLAFGADVTLCAVVTNSMMAVDGVFYRMANNIFTMDLVLLLAFSVTSAYARRCSLEASSAPAKHDLEQQLRIRRRLMTAAIVPTIGFALMSLCQSSPGHNSEEVCTFFWLMFVLAQLYLCTWILGPLTYKLLLMGVFNTVYCGVWFYRGYFQTLQVSRLVIPVAFSAMFFLNLDRFMKENFLLKCELKRQRDMYQSFLQQIQDPVVMFTKDKLLFSNQAAKKRFGDSVPNCLARFAEVKSARGARLSDEVQQRLRNEGEDASGRVPRECYYDHSARIVPDASGRRGSVAILKRRSSKLGAIAESIKRLGTGTNRGGTKAFENSAGEAGKPRTLNVAIIESQLLGHNKSISMFMRDITEELEAEEKKTEDKFKNMLLFSLSHELKTPLNIFQGFLYAAKKYMTTAIMRNMLRDSKGAWRYLRNKIGDILDYAQLLSNEFSLHESAFSIRRFTEYLRKTTFCLLMDKRSKVLLDFAVQDSIPDELEADRDRLEQVLFNFLSNAVKFTTAGSITFRVTMGPKARVRFEVRDTGCGMPKTALSQLFNLKPAKCLQDMQTHSRKSTGLSGLGLTVSHMICQKMGSDISATSDLGKGSGFAFSIPYGPVTPSHDAASCTYSEESIPEEDGKINECPRSETLLRQVNFHRVCMTVEDRKRASHTVVLVVDDNDFNRYVAEQMISKFGFRIYTATNGRSAIESLHSLAHTVQKDANAATTRIVVFMDIDMPVMDGIQATVCIRGEKALPQPYIIALTAFSSELERGKCFEAGMDLFVAKPLTKERLYEVFYNLGVINQ